eukprot:10426408-Alexandrium_andersonii.AAC.1
MSKSRRRHLVWHGAVSTARSSPSPVARSLSSRRPWELSPPRRRSLGRLPTPSLSPGRRWPSEPPLALRALASGSLPSLRS